jgi:DNA-binding MarR family transcriptional regulator
LTIFCHYDKVLSILSASKTSRIEALFAEVNAVAIRLRGGLSLIGREDGYSGGVSAVLEALGGDGPRTVPGVARERGTSRQNIQVVVNRLKEAGLVVLEGNPAHKRSALVRLTEQGKSALHQIRQAENKRLEGLLAQIPEEDLACASRVLSEIRQSLVARGGNETDKERPSPRPSRSLGEEETKERRRQYLKPPVIEESTSDEEDFPLNLL